MWDHLDRRLRQRVPPQQNRQQLEQALFEEWDRIHDDASRRLTASMRRRILALIDAMGAHTRSNHLSCDVIGH